MQPIDPRLFEAELRAIANAYPISLEGIVFVPSVSAWCNERGIEQKHPNRTACVVQNERTKEWLIVMAQELSISMQRAVTSGLLTRGFFEEVDSLKDPRNFVLHLFLHEVAHPLDSGASEDACDEWAFKELAKYRRQASEGAA